LKEGFPAADTFAVALLWEFVKDPQTATGRIRATPIVGSSLPSSSPAPSPSLPPSNARLSSVNTPASQRRRSNLLDVELSASQRRNSNLLNMDSPASQRRRSNLLDTSSTLSARKTSRIGENISTSLYSSSPRTNSSVKTSQVFTSSTSRTTKKSPLDTPKPLASVDLDESLNKTEKVVSTTVTTTKKKVTQLRDGSGTVKEIVEETTPTVIKTTRRSIVGQEAEDQDEEEEMEDAVDAPMEEAQDEDEAMEVEATEEQQEEEEEVEEEPAPVSLPPSKGRTPRGKKDTLELPRKLVTPTATATPPRRRQGVVEDVAASPATAATRRGGRRVPASPSPALTPASRKRKKPVAEEEEVEEEEVSVKTKVTRKEADESAGSSSTATVFDASLLPFDDTPPKKEAGKRPVGRKSMAARASLSSAAQEWPQEDREALLHFYDNLNPKNSETSRVALTCKYALLQYDRDLSSKLLFTWLGQKGREVMTEVTNFTLEESRQKEAVLSLYRSLSEGQTEATRTAFTLKFVSQQYGLSVTSKQLFAWLKGGK